MAKALTPKGIEHLKPDPEKRREVADPGLSGLYVVIQTGGAKSWALRYRFGGKPCKLTLGRWPEMGLAEARAAASVALEQVERGTNPASEKKAAKAAAVEAQLSERDRVKTLVALYAARHLSGLRSGRTVARELERHVVAAWADRNVTDIRKRDVIDLLDGIAASGRVVTANRLRAYLNAFLGWCVSRDVLSANPAQGVKAAAREIARDRVLSDDEIRWFWAACDSVGYPWGALGKLLLLTGQRLGEVAAMTRAEVTGDLWTLTAERTKNARAHDVPLSAPAQAVLAGVERIESKRGLFFTTTGASPVSGFFKARAHLAEAMEKIAAKERGEAVAIPRWTFHDLRRTAATGMARLGVPVRTTEAVLNHVSGTGGGIVAVYQRHDYADEKRQALDAWARHVAALVDGRRENVVALLGAR